MSKKEFSNISRHENLSGGLSNLIKPSEDKEVKEAVADDTIKTFKISKDDYSFILRYVRHMAYKNNDKYTQQKALNDAISLLRKKHPEV